MIEFVGKILAVVHAAAFALAPPAFKVWKILNSALPQEDFDVERLKHFKKQWFSYCC